jgi:hypothetical protein
MRSVVLGLVIVGRRQWATKDLGGDVDINRRESWRAVVLSCPNGPLMSLIALVTALRDTQYPRKLRLRSELLMGKANKRSVLTN